MRNFLRRKWYDFTWWANNNDACCWLLQIWYCHHNARVIADFEHRMSIVLQECTRGMSKAYYTTEAMVGEINDLQNILHDEAYEDGQKDGREEGGFTCTGGLTFGAIRAANTSRQSGFPDTCKNWSLGSWANAMQSEFGEAGNIIKKIERGDFTLDEGRERLGDEFADGLTYLDVLAGLCGIDLAEAYVRKWNEVSAKRGMAVRLVLEPTVVE